MAKAKRQQENMWNTVTPLSKMLAFFLFISFPFIGFYLGMQYQRTVDEPFMREEQEAVSIKGPETSVCTMDVRECPDGSYVGRSGPHCEFEMCPGN